MARHHPHHHHRQPQDPKAAKQSVVLTVLSALLGITFGFAGGRFFAEPLQRPGPAGPGAAGSASDLQQPLPAAGAPLPDRIAAAGRMSEDALSGVLAAVHDEWVRRSGSAPEGTPPPLLHFRIIFSRWTDLSGPNALKAALSLKDSRLNDAALEAVMTEWGLRDTRAASQSTTLIPWAAARQRALVALIRAGVVRSPAEGLAVTDMLTLAPQNLLRRAAGAEWMLRDATHAMRFLKEKPGVSGALPAGTGLGQWLMEDPAGFMAWRKAEPAVAKSIPPVRFPKQSLTPGHLTRLASVLVKEFGTLDAGAAWLHEAAGVAARPVVRALLPPQPLEQAEMKSWRDMAANLPAIGTATGWLARRSHARELSDLASAHANSDPAAALQWLAALPPDEEAARLSPAVAAQWLTHAPASAAEQLFAGDLTNPVVKEAAFVAVDLLARANPLRALEVLPKLKVDPATVRSLEGAAFQQLSASSPDAMLQWLETHPESAAPAKALGMALKITAAADAARAIAWVRRHAPAGDRPAVTADILGIWITRDRAEALRFLESLPAGKERDAAITQLVTSELAMTDPFFAANMLPDCFEQALQFSSDTGRLDLLRSVLRRMKEMNVAAEPSLNHRSLRPADREALLKNP